jgi:hypothetical protein
MRLPLAIGAVVDGVPSTFQMPLSGQFEPVDARVPRGHFVVVFMASISLAVAKMQAEEYRQAARAWGALLNPIENGAPTSSFNQGAGSRKRIPPFAILQLPVLPPPRQRKSSFWTKNVLHREIEFLRASVGATPVLG